MTLTTKGKQRLEVINKKVDIITNLVALWATQGRSFEDRVKILNRFFSVKEISVILDKTQKDVREGIKF